MKRQSALVVFSGGQDSTTCLFWALKHYETVELVTFAYGQRHSLEIEVAKEIAQEQGLKHHVLDMSLLGQITENALTSDIEIEAEEGEVPNTFVDGRNHLFLSFAAILAKQRGITDIVTGVCERQTFLVIQTVVMFLSNRLMSHLILPWPMILLSKPHSCGWIRLRLGLWLTNLELLTMFVKKR